jgi:hypothetical protein
VNHTNRTGTVRREPSPVQRAGNRFGVTAVVFALLAGLCAASPGLRQVAWALAPVGVALGGIGLVLWSRGRATNRDDALIGAGLAYVVLMVLLCQVAATLPTVPTAPLPDTPTPVAQIAMAVIR